jgi:hypothetical protein
LDVVDEDGFQICEQFGAHGQGKSAGRRACCKTEVGLGRLQGFGEEAPVEGAGAMPAVLPARERDPECWIGWKFVALSPSTRTQRAQ